MFYQLWIETKRNHNLMLSWPKWINIPSRLFKRLVQKEVFYPTRFLGIWPKNLKAHKFYGASFGDKLQSGANTINCFACPYCCVFVECWCFQEPALHGGIRAAFLLTQNSPSSLWAFWLRGTVGCHVVYWPAHRYLVRLCLRNGMATVVSNSRGRSYGSLALLFWQSVCLQWRTMIDIAFDPPLLQNFFDHKVIWAQRESIAVEVFEFQIFPFSQCLGTIGCVVAIIFCVRNRGSIHWDLNSSFLALYINFSTDSPSKHQFLGPQRSFETINEGSNFDQLWPIFTN